MSSTTSASWPFWHQLTSSPQRGKASGWGKPKTKQKGKWKAGGREYFLLGYLSQSNKLLFCFGFTSVSSSGALTPISKMDRNMKIQEMTEGRYV